jgi:hypothetical protein
MTQRLPRVIQTVTRAAALAALLLFISTSFRAGWNKSATDFPNYYTAAVLIRHGERLHHFYDWTWFQRQMSYAGFERQLGAYTPQTPLTMIPFVPLTQTPPQTAKRLWLAANLAFLGAVVWMLAAMTGMPIEQIALLALCGYGSMATNFGLGQYYVFLLFLMTLTVFLLRVGRSAAAGFLSGITFGLKLYTGPVILYFFARRKWRAAAGMAAGSFLMLLVAIAIFGWADVWMYLSQVLPRTLGGGSIDPYNPGVPTFATLLRRLFLREPELNPQPLANAPWLFFGMLALVRFALVSAAILGAAFTREPEADDGLLAWFLVLLVLLSVSTASYTFILLLAPVVLVWPTASKWKRLLLTTCYILLNIPIRPAWLFPKLWLLFALFLVVGFPFLRAIPIRWALCSATIAVALAGLDASREVRMNAQEPTNRYSQVSSDSQALFSSFPAISKFGLFYQCMGGFTGQAEERYVLCWSHDGLTERLAFSGHVFRPRVAALDGSIWFELVAGARSETVRFDPATRTVTVGLMPVMKKDQGAVVSGDGRWVAFIRGPAGRRELWVRSVAEGTAERIAAGRCDNGDPAWELDSSAVVFASDCSRAYGLPALYHAPVASWLGQPRK